MYIPKISKSKYIIKYISLGSIVTAWVTSMGIIIDNNAVLIDVTGSAADTKLSSSTNIYVSSKIVSSNELVEFIPVSDEFNWNIGYTEVNSIIRQTPSVESNIVTNINFNEKVYYSVYSDEWYEVKYQDKIGYVSKNCISLNPISFKSYVLSSSGFKSFMPYDAITDTSSIQYQIQNSFAYTGNYGIRQIEGRYCVALGSAIECSIGTYIDLILSNGISIPCVLSDQKSDEHTQSDRLTTAVNGCVSEFLIDNASLDNKIKYSGDVSFANENWKSPVVEIRVYAKTVFNK